MIWGYLVNVFCATILFSFNKRGDIFEYMTAYALLLSLINLFLSGLLKIFLRKIEFESIFYFCSVCIMIIAILLGFLYLREDPDLPQDFWFNDYFNTKLRSPYLSDNGRTWLYTKKEFWWLLGPLYLISLFLLIKLLSPLLLYFNKKIKYIFFSKTSRISVASLKDFFLTIDSNNLAIKNIHKRLIQFNSILFVYVIFKRDYLINEPSGVFFLISVFCVMWIIYYFLARPGDIILNFIIKRERFILFFSIINLIHNTYKYFDGTADFFDLYVIALLPVILYIIIFLFNQKTSLEYPLQEKIAKLNVKSNFYIQQNIYLNYLLGFSLYYGQHKPSYILYLILFSWIALFLYLKLILPSKKTDERLVPISDKSDLSIRKWNIIILLFLTLIISVFLFFYYLPD